MRERLQHTYHPPEHCKNNCSSKAPCCTFAYQAHNNISYEQNCQRKVTPVGRENEWTSLHCSVFYARAWKLKLGEEHEEKDDVDWNCEKVDKLWTVCKKGTDMINLTMLNYRL